MNERCPIHSTAAMDVVHTNELQCVLLQAKARIAELEDALRNTVAALRHYGPYIADKRVVREADELLGEAK